MSETPRTPTEDERSLARQCAALAQRAAAFMAQVGEGEAQVSDLVVERMWDFSAFPIVTRDEIEKLGKAVPA